MALAGIVVIFVLGFLYIGSAHRDRCIKDGNTGCSILPWSGYVAPIQPIQPIHFVRDRGAAY